MHPRRGRLTVTDGNPSTSRITACIGGGCSVVAPTHPCSAAPQLQCKWGFAPRRPPPESDRRKSINQSYNCVHWRGVFGCRLCGRITHRAEREREREKGSEREKERERECVCVCVRARWMHDRLLLSIHPSRAKREQLERFCLLWPESQGQNLAVTVL